MKFLSTTLRLKELVTRTTMTQGREGWLKQMLETGVMEEIEVMRLTHGSPLCRTISPPMVGVTSSILLPNLREKNYKLRHGMINMIEGMQFHGLPSKDFVLHLRKFLRLTNTVRSLANAHDYIRLYTFLFSLVAKAEDWFYDLPNRSITTWDQCSMQHP